MSTIAASGLDCRVRNENGYNPAAEPPEPNTRNVRDIEYDPTSLACWRATKGKKVKSAKDNCAIQSSARETGHISTPRLHALRRFHLEPINVIISHESHNDS